MTVAAASLHRLHSEPLIRPTSTPHGVATAHFGALHDPVLRFIAQSDAIVGCVAWITSGKILDALAGKRVALVVQKESWWKKGDARGSSLARRYANLSCGLPASAFPDPLGSKTFRGKPVPNDSPIAPIACVGYGNSSQFQPLMHHKFIVRCTLDPDGALVPQAVWTGSFNFSANANDSFENAVEIHDPTIAAAYLSEFALVASLSEPMNWRFSKPTPKGAAAGAVEFAPLPPKPKQTTTRVVRGAGKKRATTKKATGRPATKTATASRTRTSTVTPIKSATAKKTTPKTAAKKTVARKTTTARRAAS